MFKFSPEVTFFKKNFKQIFIVTKMSTRVCEISIPSRQRNPFQKIKNKPENPFQTMTSE